MTANPRRVFWCALVLLAVAGYLYSRSAANPIEIALFATLNLAVLGLVWWLTGQNNILSQGLIEPMLDPDTKVLNLRAFYSECDLELHRARRSNIPVSLVDVRFSHSKDQGLDDYIEAVEEAVDEIRSRLRGTDIIGRYSDAEFVIELSNADDHMAAIVVDRIRPGVAEFFPGNTCKLNSVTFVTLPESAHEAVKKLREAGDAPAKAAAKGA